MEEQERPQEVEQPAAEETQEVAETPEPQAEQTPDADVSDAVDDKGVPYKNRAAMYQRQLEDVRKELSELKAAIPKPEVPKAAPVDPKANLDEFVQMGPDAWYEKRRQQERRQELMQQADRMIYEKDPTNYQANVQQVFDVAKEWNIDLQANPVLGVQKVFEIQNLKSQATAKPTPEKKAAEKKRVENIKKTQPEGGAKPPAPPVDKSAESLSKLRRTGSMQDVEAYLRDIL